MGDLTPHERLHHWQASLASRVDRFSPRLAAYLDWISPWLHAPWGGPMNGQQGRRDMVRRLAAAIEPTVVVETGTYHGDTTLFLADITGVPVHTVEAVERHYHFARWRLGNRDDVRLVHDDSRSFLRRATTVIGDSPMLVYLDAHWGDDLPLATEIELIAGAWHQAVVVIDDFQVPGDAGYRYDDYGPGKALREELLPPAVADWHRLYPALPSRQETGHRRGCVVLVPPAYDVAELASAAHLTKA